MRLLVNPLLIVLSSRVLHTALDVTFLSTFTEATIHQIRHYQIFFKHYEPAITSQLWT